MLFICKFNVKLKDKADGKDINRLLNRQPI